MCPTLVGRAWFPRESWVLSNGIEAVEGRTRTGMRACALRDSDGL